MMHFQRVLNVFQQSSSKFRDNQCFYIIFIREIANFINAKKQETHVDPFPNAITDEIIKLKNARAHPLLSFIPNINNFRQTSL